MVSFQTSLSLNISGTKAVKAYLSEMPIYKQAVIRKQSRSPPSNKLSDFMKV